jgi:hypothetical protein
LVSAVFKTAYRIGSDLGRRGLGAGSPRVFSAAVLIWIADSLVAERVRAYRIRKLIPRWARMVRAWSMSAPARSSRVVMAVAASVVSSTYLATA